MQTGVIIVRPNFDQTPGNLLSMPRISDDASTRPSVASSQTHKTRLAQPSSYQKQFTILRADQKNPRKWAMAQVKLNRVEVSTFGHALALMSEAFGTPWRQQWLRNLFTVDGREVCSMNDLFPSSPNQRKSGQGGFVPDVLVGVGSRSCLAGDSRQISLAMHRKVTPDCRNQCYLLSANEIKEIVQKFFRSTVHADSVAIIWEKRMSRRYSAPNSSASNSSSNSNLSGSSQTKSTPLQDDRTLFHQLRQRSQSFSECSLSPQAENTRRTSSSNQQHQPKTQSKCLPLKSDENIVKPDAASNHADDEKREKEEEERNGAVSLRADVGEPRLLAKKPLHKWNEEFGENSVSKSNSEDHLPPIKCSPGRQGVNDLAHFSRKQVHDHLISRIQRSLQLQVDKENSSQGATNSQNLPFPKLNAVVTSKRHDPSSRQPFQVSSSVHSKHLETVPEAVETAGRLVQLPKLGKSPNCVFIEINSRSKIADSREKLGLKSNCPAFDPFAGSLPKMVGKLTGPSDELNAAFKNSMTQTMPSHRRSPSPSEFCSIKDVYDVGEVIGDGHFAFVHRARKLTTGEMFAVKIVDKRRVHDNEKMIRREIRIMRECHHENIVRFIDHLETVNTIIIVMELVEGGDLFGAITERSCFTEQEALGMVVDIAKTLIYLHSRSIVHRDVKPENLLVYQTHKGRLGLKLTDFGLAIEVTRPMYTVCGTPTYIAPEILLKTGYGVEVDNWALGVVTFIILAGYPPFRSPNKCHSELFNLIKSGVFKFKAPHWNKISSEAKNFVRHLLVVDVNRRLRTSELLGHPWIKSALPGVPTPASSCHVSIGRSPAQLTVLPSSTPMRQGC